MLKSRKKRRKKINKTRRKAKNKKNIHKHCTAFESTEHGENQTNWITHKVKYDGREL